MKKIYILVSTVLLSLSALAQAPEKLSYQAVIRNSNNTLVVSSPIGVRVSILQGSINGTAVYSETQNPSTNANGLVTLQIGSGTVVSGSLGTIDWSNGPFFVKTETDPTGATNYTISGTSELLSVPYAFYAKNTDPSITNSISADLAQEISDRTDADASKADIASPSLTGTPTAPTATAGTNTTQIATTEFVTNAINTQTADYLPLTGGTLTGTLTGTDANVHTLIIRDEVENYTTTFQAGAQTEDVVYTFPSDNGNTNQVLATDGTGNLSWSTLGSIATQDASSVSITGGSIDGTAIGTNNASSANFSTLNASGQVGIGTTSPATSAALEVNSTTGGVLFPRMTTAQRDALTGQDGLVVFNSTAKKLQVYISGGTYNEGNPAGQSFGYVDNTQGNTFQAENTSYLQLIGVSIYNCSQWYPSGPLTSVYTMKIYSSQGGTLLATSSNTLTANANGYTGGNFEFSSSNLLLTANTSYYFEITSDNGANFILYASYSNNYPQGTMYVNGSFNTDADVTFQMVTSTPNQWVDLH